ncbi:MAG: DUF370 domain-containing protein [Clostridia bacterium]|nr:DUF370 domain-containing protein [Clostridia bacterium]
MKDGRTLSLGFGNHVMLSRVVAIVSPDTAPVRRMVQQSRERGVLLDASFGRRTRAVVLCDSGQVILSALLPDTLASRAEAIE